jgi:mannose-6-phosphate isomerase-like protein (cupin superfamily)
MSVDLAKHVFKAGDGEQLRWGGPAAGSVTIMVDPDNSGPTDLCVLIQSLDPGAVVPIHHHEKAEQVLFIVSGSGQITLADHRVEARAGATVHVPKGVAHGIVNTGEEPLTILEVTSPPGFQNIFREMHRLSEPSAEAIGRIGTKYDIVVHTGEGS